LAQSSAATIVLVEQDAAAVLPLTDMVYVLSRGSVAFAGEPADLPTDGAQALSSNTGTS
jgi:ABC-type branched-subunit amino acid transport system ATPase component